MPSMYGQSSFDDLLNEYAAQAPAGGIVPSPGNISSPWKSFMSFINAPVNSGSGDASNLMAYKPVTRLEGLGQILTSAAQGVLSARGPYRNPLGMGLMGAGIGAQQAKEEDQQRRQAAVQDQYKQMAAMLQMANAKAALAKAQAAGQHVVGEGQRVVDQTGNVIATGAPKTGEANGYVYQTDPNTGQVTPMARFPGQPTSIEGLAVNALTGQQPQLFNGNAGAGGVAPGGGGAGAVPANGFPGGNGGGIDPGMASKILNAWIVDKTKPVASTMVMNPQFRQAQAESAYSTDMGHQSAESYKNYMTAGAAAQKTLDNNKLLRSLAGSIDTGPQQPIRQKLQQYASAAGLPDGMFTNLGNAQAFNAIAGKSVLDAAGGHFSQGFSDADRNFATSLAANLANTPKANTILLDASDAAQQRVKQMQGEAIKWEVKHRQNGGLYATDENGKTFDMHMQEWADQHPLFTPEWMKAHGLDPNNPGGGGGGASRRKLEDY